MLEDEYAERRRRGNIRIENLPACRAQSCDHTGFDRRPILPTIPANDDWPWTKRLHKRGHISRGNLRREAFPHDAPQAGNADNRFGHVKTPGRNSLVATNIPCSLGRHEWKPLNSFSGSRDPMSNSLLPKSPASWSGAKKSKASSTCLFAKSSTS